MALEVARGRMRPEAEVGRWPAHASFASVPANGADIFGRDLFACNFQVN